jgi:hypothetical protein
MGTTVITVVRNRAEGRMMLSFLKRFHWTCLDGKIGDHVRTAVDGPLDRGFSYAEPNKGENAIGFNYTGGFLQWQFTWSICAFIALRIGKHKFEMLNSPYLINEDEEFTLSLTKREDAKRVPGQMATYIESLQTGFIQPDTRYAHLDEGDELRKMEEEFYGLLRNDLYRAYAGWQEVKALYSARKALEISITKAMASKNENTFNAEKVNVNLWLHNMSQILERMKFKDLGRKGE